MPSTRSPGREKEDPPSTDAPVPQMEAMVVGNHTPKPRWTYRGPRCLSHRRSHVSLHQDIHPASLNPQGGNLGPTDVSRTGLSGWESRAGPEEGPRAGRAAVAVSGSRGASSVALRVAAPFSRRRPPLSASRLGHRPAVPGPCPTSWRKDSVSAHAHLFRAKLGALCTALPFPLGTCL